MRVYIEVSKNHGYNIGYVIKNKFKPEIKLLIMYYNNLFIMEAQELERIKKENEKTINKGVEI